MGRLTGQRRLRLEEILATTLFRVYRSIGGDSADLGRRRFASRMMLYLILRAVQNLTPATDPAYARDFCAELMATDQLNWTSEGIYGGAYSKVFRWSFEATGRVPEPASHQRWAWGRHDRLPGPPARQGRLHRRRSSRRIPVPARPLAHDDDLESAQRGRDHHARGAGARSDQLRLREGQEPRHADGDQRSRAGLPCKPGAGLLWPGDFEAFTTAQITVGTVAGNNSEEKIVGPFEWTPNINANGHDCMLMVVSADGDPSMSMPSL